MRTLKYRMFIFFLLLIYTAIPTFFGTLIYGHLLESKKSNASVVLNYQQNKKYTIALKDIESGSFSDKINEFSKLVDKLPINADINIENEKIIKYPEVNGIKVNNLNVVNLIQKKVIKTPYKSYNITLTNDEVTAISPFITLKHLEDAKRIIGKESSIINLHYDSMNTFAMAINKVLVVPYFKEDGKIMGEFSFNKYISKELIIQKNEGYKEVIKVLKSALLKSSINSNNIFEESDNFRFRNTLKNAIVIFTKVSDSSLDVYVVGK